MGRDAVVIPAGDIYLHLLGYLLPAIESSCMIVGMLW